MNVPVKHLFVTLFLLGSLLSGCGLLPTDNDNGGSTPVDTPTIQPAVSCEDFMQLDLLTLLSTTALAVDNVDLSGIIFDNYCRYHCTVAASGGIDTTDCFAVCTADETTFRDCSGSSIPFGGVGGDGTGANGSDQSSDVGDPQTGIQLSNLKWTSQCLTFDHNGNPTEIMVQKLYKFPNSQTENYFWNTVSQSGHLTIHDPEKEVYVSMVVSQDLCASTHRFFILVYKDPAVLASAGFYLFQTLN